ERMMANQPDNRTDGDGAPRMPFNRHRGRRLDELPPGYLNWLVTQCTYISSDIRDVIVAEARRWFAADRHRARGEKKQLLAPAPRSPGTLSRSVHHPKKTKRDTFRIVRWPPVFVGG